MAFSAGRKCRDAEVDRRRSVRDRGNSRGGREICLRPQNYGAREGREGISGGGSHRHPAGSSLLRQRGHTAVRAASTAGGESATGGGFRLAAELGSAAPPGAAVPAGGHIHSPH